MAFSTVAGHPSGCYSNRLARATVSNVGELKTYVDNLFPSGKDICMYREGCVIYYYCLRSYELQRFVSERFRFIYSIAFA